MKFTRVSKEEFEKLTGIRIKPTKTTNKDDEFKMPSPDKKCCCNCAYYDFDYPYKICMNKKHRGIFDESSGEKVCEDFIFGKWDRYGNKPIIIEIKKVKENE